MKPTTLNTLLANQSQQSVSALVAKTLAETTPPPVSDKCEALEAVEK